MSDDEGDVEFEKEEFYIRGIKLNITTISFLPIHKLMQLNQTSTEISGQKLWCGSLVLCEYILDHAADVVKDKIVIELGAGTGVAGMICYQQGASKVYLSDYDAKSLEHMRVDCEDNGIAADIVSFDYYNPIYETFESTANTSYTVIAGDVIYKTALIVPFFNSIKQFVTRFRARVLLCHIPRAGVNHEHITAEITRQSLRYEVVDGREWCKGVVLQYSPREDYERAQLYIISDLVT